jgi:hypothetical protein
MPVWFDGTRKKGGRSEKGGVRSIVPELPFTLVDSDRTGEPFSFVLRSAQSPGIMKYPVLFPWRPLSRFAFFAA